MTPKPASRHTTAAQHARDERVAPYSGPTLVGASNGKVSLHFCNIEKLRLTVEDCLNTLPEEDRVRARQFLRGTDRLRFCIGRLMLRTLLAAHTGRTPRSIELSIGPHGKPCLVDGPSFNLSHSGSAVLVGIADSGDLGVDVEAVKEIGDVDGLARHCLSPREIEALAAWPTCERLRPFLRAWTRKEAFVKALGTGLKIDTRHFSVAMDEMSGNALLDAKACCADADSWTVLPVRLPGAFEAAVAWNRPSVALHVQEFDLDLGCAEA